MARASITVRSQHEADAMKLALEHPAIRTAHVITGLLLQLPLGLRTSVLRLAEDNLLLASTSADAEPVITMISPDGDVSTLRLRDGGGSNGE